MEIVDALRDHYDSLFVNYSNDVSVAWSRWMVTRYHIPLIIAVAYVITIFSVREVMKDKKPFKLRWPLILWNAGLALFSITGFYVLLIETIRVLSQHGFIYDLCGADAEMTNPWTLLFCLSKIPELIDTVFIVLRKRPLIFLHYYHHIVTMFYCWDSYAVRVHTGGWFAFMNLFVHSIMYSYYAAAAYGIRFPQPIRQSITTLQIIQMVAGTLLTILSLSFCEGPDYPERVRLNLWVGLLMYFSYWILFVHYFRQNYTAPAEKKDATATTKQDDKKKN